jgi:hypothetical protein
VGVFLAYSSPIGRCLIDRELYLPQEWLNDPGRRRKAGIPPHREYASHGRLALTAVERAYTAGVSAQWVTGDTAYGTDEELRESLEKAGTSYVLAVPGDQPIRSRSAVRTAEELAGAARAGAQVIDGEGARAGWRTIDLLLEQRPFASASPTGRWLLLSQAGPNAERRFWLVSGPIRTPLAQLASVAEAGSGLGQCLDVARSRCGLDDYEVRRYPGWYRHVTLSMFAHVFLAGLGSEHRRLRW